MKDDYKFKSPLREEMALYMERCKLSLAESTYRTRLMNIHDFDNYLVSVGYQKGEPIDEPLVTGWQAMHNHLSPNTLVVYTSDIRNFLTFYSKIASARVYLPPSLNQDDSYIPYLFSDEEMDVIYNLLDNYKSNKYTTLPYIEIELPMAIRLLEACGFRLTELITTRMTEVDLTNGILKMIATKNEHERLVPLDDEMTMLLQAYCKKMNLREGTAACLFPRLELTSPLKKEDIEHRFKRVLIRAGISGKKSSKLYAREACVHCLRHRFTLNAIKQLLSLGITLEDTIPYLSIYLGHKSLRETERYMKFFEEAFPGELDKFAEEASELFPDDSIWNDWM